MNKGLQNRLKRLEAFNRGDSGVFSALAATIWPRVQLDDVSAFVRIWTAISASEGNELARKIEARATGSN